MRMRAIRYRGAGGPEVIELSELPTPAPDPTQLLVRVHAAGLNRADLIQRRGAYPAPPGWPPDIPGLEYVGEVEAVGSAVRQRTVGERVMGLVGGGAHAEYLVVDEREVLRVPESLGWTSAAAIPEAWLTAYDALVARGRACPGERVLIHAVGSGVSTAAVQLAKWLGLTVIGTSRTRSKLERARALGMDHGIDTSAAPFGGQLEQPVDIVLDFFGGGSFSQNLSALAPRGRLVLLGTLQGGTAEQADLSRVLRFRLEVIGTVMRTRQLDERIPLVEEFGNRVVPLFAEGRFRPIVGAEFPMSRLSDAHLAMERNEVFGKIVLTW